jgi:hypothetical protein
VTNPTSTDQETQNRGALRMPRDARCAEQGRPAALATIANTLRRGDASPSDFAVAYFADDAFAEARRAVRRVRR